MDEAAVNDPRRQHPHRRPADRNPHYDARYFEWQSSGGRSLALLEKWKFADFIRGSDTVLDFGCGGGYILGALTCRERYGIEVNPVAREVAARSLKVYGDIDELPSGLLFDVVISHHALEHVDEPLRQLRRLNLRLKSGGRAIVVVPSETWFNQRKYRASDVNQHLYAWTPLTLGNLFTRAGFAVEQVDLLRHRFLPKASIACQIMPTALFHICCSIWGTVTRTRQIRIVCARP